MTHSVTLFDCESQIQKRKVPAAMWGIGKKEKKTTRGVFVLCLNSATEGVGGCGRSGGGVEGGEPREEWDKREEVSSQLPSLRPKNARRFSSSPRHQPSVLSCHYFTSHRAHTPSLRHTYAQLHHHTVSVPPWSTLKRCQHQILKHGQLKQNEKTQRKKFVVGKEMPFSFNC